MSKYKKGTLVCTPWRYMEERRYRSTASGHSEWSTS